MIRVRDGARHFLVKSIPAAACLGALAMGQQLRASDSFKSAPQVVLVPSQVPIPPAYFSMNILFHPLTHVPWPSVPLGGWRTSHVNWPDLEPDKNNWRFDLLDKYVDWSQAHNLPILMLLTYTPRWVSNNPDAPSDFPAMPGISGAPRDMGEWRTFVRTVATRYKGRIRNWEIWNEPNRAKDWTGDIPTMVEMAKEAYQILKEVDPSCVVVSPSATESTGVSYLDAYLAAGGGNYADVIGYHFYVGDDPPEAIVPLIRQVEAVMRKRGVATKPLWDTEGGWLKSPPLAPDAAAAYVARAEILNWASGVSRFYWYAWEALTLKINFVQRDFGTLTPAGQSFASVQRWLVGNQMDRCESRPDGIWVCDLRQSGVPRHIAWSTRGPMNLPVPADWHVRGYETLAGERRDISGGSIGIDQAPVLIQ